MPQGINPIESWLNEIDNKSKAIINLGNQLYAITPKMHEFDFLLIAALNRTVNLNKAFISLIRDNNFIAAAPLVRINLDTLMRLFASIISEHDRNTFASKILSGEVITKMKARNSTAKLIDSYLVKQLSEIEGMEWVNKVYQAGNSFVHFGDAVIFSSKKIEDEGDQIVNFTIGFHDNFIPDSEKVGATIWKNKIIDSIIVQAQIWMLEKAKSVGYNIEDLNRL